MILFLDFDGVTHPEPYAPEAAFTQLPLIESVVRERVHVAIVVSSSWRESHSLDELRDFFAPDIQPRVVGVTPDMWDQALAPAYVRERECLAWLAANRPAGTRWLAIDDRPAFFQPNCLTLFLTDTLQGFQPAQMASLREKLTMDSITHSILPADIPMTGLKAYITDLAKRHDVVYVKTGSSALAQVITRLAGDDGNPDETEKLVIALRRANVINGPTAVTLLGLYFDETRN